MKSQQRFFIIAFLAPAGLLFTVFVAWPSMRALLYSLQRWNGLGTPEWIGLENFRALFNGDDLFQRAFTHNIVLIFGAGTITLALALFFAGLLHRRIRGTTLFRVAFFFPNILSSVAIALLWMLLYSTTDFGAFNAILAQLHNLLSAMNIHWLDDTLPYAFTDSRHLIYAIIPMMVWTATGFYMVLFLAAMEGIPESYYEAARLEGASGASQFWHITFPLIRDVFIVGVVFLIIGGMKFFDAIWVMESQYPSKDSHVLATVLYQKVFTEYNIGYGAAVAVVLFVVVFWATLITLRMSNKEAVEY